MGATILLLRERAWVRAMDAPGFVSRVMTFQPAAGYPLHRPRRLRGHPRLRDLVREQRLTVDDLIYPLFVYHGKNLRREIASMPGQYQLSLDRLGEAVAEVAELGIPAVILFGIPEHKDARGSAASRDDGHRPGGDPARQDRPRPGCW